MFEGDFGENCDDFDGLVGIVIFIINLDMDQSAHRKK